MFASRFLAGLLATTLVISAPYAAAAAVEPVACPPPPPGKGKPTTKPNSTQKGQSSSKSSRHAESRNNVAQAKTTVKRGKPSLRSLKNSLVKLAARADALKPVRMQLRGQALQARNTYRRNPTPENRAAWRAASNAYMPVRQAHESARAQRNATNTRYKRTKKQMANAVNSSGTTPAARASRFPTPGRPKIRRQARVTSLAGFASSANSATGVYGVVPPLSREPSGNFRAGYAMNTADFRRGVESQPTYMSINAINGGNSSSGTLPSVRLSSSTLPTVNIGGQVYGAPPVVGRIAPMQGQVQVVQNAAVNLPLPRVQNVDAP